MLGGGEEVMCGVTCFRGGGEVVMWGGGDVFGGGPAAGRGHTGRKVTCWGGERSREGGHVRGRDHVGPGHVMGGGGGRAVQLVEPPALQAQLPPEGGASWRGGKVTC